MRSLYDRVHAMLPAWCTFHRCLMFWSLFIGAAGGGALSWHINKPPPPWMHFEWLTATYQPDDEGIRLTGRYFVERQCDAPVIWRQEARATDGQVAQYGPVSGLPDLSMGMHDYNDVIRLTQRILPDGWRVLLLVTCTKLPQETIVSPFVRVSIVAPIAPGL